jgi:predicted cupin superfamily sugar epimerase
MQPSEVASRWRLQPHPEGGYYRETYRSAWRTTPPGWTSPRPLATAILYMLPPGERSAWHRVKGEELWVWQGGGPMLLEVGSSTVLVGPDANSSEELQVLVPAGCWQRATPAGAEWSMVGCLVAPGFDFEDFELGPPR